MSDGVPLTSRGGGGQRKAPLEGVKVLDFTRYLAGPYCTMLLSDYGADVIRVEKPGPREFRFPGSDRDSYFFLSSNRGKRSLGIDYRSDAGRELILRMMSSFDVMVENFRPGVIGALGFDPETLCVRHPRLICCSISGFGASGPYRDRPGFDQIAQGMSGFMSVTGTEESGPTRGGLAVADLLAGIFAAQGIQLALLERTRSGMGQIVDTSLLESMVGVLSWSAGIYFETGCAPGPAGQHHPLSSPYGRFKASDGYLNIAAASDAMWRSLAGELGRLRWLEDPRFESAPMRVACRQELCDEIEEVLATNTVGYWVAKLNEAGVPAGPVLNIAEVFADPQVAAREMLVELPHPQLGVFKTTGLAVKLRGSPGGITRRPPLCGEHSVEVLRECGMQDGEIASLQRDGVIFEPRDEFS